MQDHFANLSNGIVNHQMSSAASQHEATKTLFVTKIRHVQWCNYLGLQLIRRRLSHFPPGMITLVPASRWLFDNYQLLYRDLKAFQESGGVARFRHLPVIKNGPGKGYPRIYLVALKMISLTNLHLNEEVIIDLVNEYQTARVLTTAELSLLPDVLNVCLIERIIQESKRIIPAIEDKVKANDLMNKIAPQFIKDEYEGLSTLKTNITAPDIRNHTFSSHLIYRLKSLSVNPLTIADWMADILSIDKEAGPGLVTEITEKERLFEAETEGTISALIGSFEELSNMDHDHYFNSVSLLESNLGEDPSGTYPDMDGATRARYREEVVKLAERFKMREIEIAQNALMLCKSPPESSDFPVPHHVGTYLVGSGRPCLRAVLSGKPVTGKSRSAIFRTIRRVVYFAGILLITVGLVPLVGLLVGLKINSLRPTDVLFLLTLLIPASGMAVFIMNSFYTRLVDPKVTLAMDYEKNIPESCRTFVVMPVILTSPSGASRCVASLERHYLANRKENLFFALLIDFVDADAQTLPEDASIIRAAESDITALNQKYPSRNRVFSLFFREREWNPAQKCWMGRERKRGKLEDFNALMAGETETSYLIPVGDPSVFPTIKYVITLDADTELPHDSASKLIGVIDHPLNQPVIDPTGSHVISGYVIVQSEVRNRIPAPSAGLFQTVLSGQGGFDPYATIVSDVYQDTFNEGIYAGKGIYHLQAFHELLYQKIPDNQVLSHDLLEGSLTRCAFASGIKLVDKVPASIDSYVRREHRWIRGDWQLLPYLVNKSKINLLSRWKILDNLRRSLMHPAQLLLIICNIFLFPQAPWVWMIFLFFEPAINIAQVLLSVVIRKLSHISSRIAFLILMQNLADHVLQSLYSFLLLPIRAYMALDAIVRTLYRLLVSHHNLLEWQTAEAVEKKANTSIRYYIHLMWPSFLPAVILLYGAFLPVSWLLRVLFILFALLWFLSPIIASLSGKRLPRKVSRFPSDSQTRQLRLLAAQIWHYFVDFSDAEHNWLCPDHQQEIPGPKTADRTSPTNIGLQLLANLSARDLGFVGLISLVDACERIIRVVDSLTTWYGHLYNWYDTKTLQVIDPQYVSTVDSGNFLAHLITLKRGLVTILQKPVYQPVLLVGLTDLQEADRQQSDSQPVNGAQLYTATTNEGLNALYQSIDERLADMKTGIRTRAFCLGLIEDRERLSAGNLSDLLKTPRELVEAGNTEAASLVTRIERMIIDIDYLVGRADFKPLFDSRKRLFLIGYHVKSQKPDRSHYDLMASEARLASFLAIAKGDVPKRHWLSLGRPLTLVRGIPALVSWSGSMFEYLMPNLVMRVPPGSILDHSCRAAVISQIKYGRKLGTPWGISESQFYIFDNQANYQYGPFGVLRMRLQPSLKPAKVIAPYATLLALGTAPRKALKNINALQKAGAVGRYGFYEALDYNSPDSGQLTKHSLVRSFMTHHLGMSLAAINNLLNENILQTRFHAEPMIRANEILLEETFTSPMVTIASIGYAIDVESKEPQQDEMESRICNTVTTPYPVAHTLSNGHYQLMLTTKGDGFSACDDVMINRWRPDQHDGGSGSFVYIREKGSGRLWSTTYLPVMSTPDAYRVIFSHDKAEYYRTDGQITTASEITVSPVDQMEIRRITLTNHSQRAVTLELTSYLEVVADSWMADVSHPAYSKLFIETKFIPERKLLIATRRPKSPTEQHGYVMHLVRTDDHLARPVRSETSRQDFIGRGGSLMAPEALKPGHDLAEKGGTPTDPILCLQVVVAIPAGKNTVVSFMTGFCPTMAAVMSLSDKLTAKLSDEDIFKLARTSSLLEIQYLKIRSVQLNAIQNLIGALYYPTNVFKTGAADALSRNHIGQSGLWRFGISGDQPVMLLRISVKQDLEALKDVLLAYEFIRMQKTKTDLVILNESEDGYDDALQQLIFEQTATIRVFDQSRHQLGIFVLRANQMSVEEKNLLLTVARIVFTAETGIYFRKATAPWPVEKTTDTIFLPAGAIPVEACAPDAAYHSETVPEFFNGIGGFVRNGREYEIRLDGGIRTPAPWINVIANEHFGFQISEIGAGYTWAGNSRENKLTTWYNDPILDPVSEAVYVRNTKNGAITSPCALVPGAEGSFRVWHGFGYSVLERQDADLSLSMTVFAAADQPVKLLMLTLHNKTMAIADLSVSYYVEWVLGAFRELTDRYVKTAYDPETQLLTARNVYGGAINQGIAFQFASEPVTSYTGDRRSFIGETGNVRYPIGLARNHLSERVGAGLDPCGVIFCDLHLEPQSSKTVVFGLGQTDQMEQAVVLANRFRTGPGANAELKTVQKYWNRLPGNMTISTPDRAMDILMNGWLMYQVLSCRLRARAAFYQCGGAYGFRDQLQDVLSVMDYDEHLTRKQILLCCSRQFVEGDVQHWWHEPEGVGVRTRISDDLLWLPYVTAEYVRYTGDAAILDEPVSFLDEHALSKDQHELISRPPKSSLEADVFTHCILAIDHACRFGQHGLPLIKGGDWNDGMNLIGPEEKGESVWLGWFLYSILQKFIPICINRGDPDLADKYQKIAVNLLNNIEMHAWDGEWYMRAFFDNGEPLGSAQNDECRIDSISQSWSVLSGGADQTRAAQALRSAERLLVSHEEGLILLLTPPFGRGKNHPGYISGYTPGIRENGGQYTHAAVWLAMSYCEMGDGSEAYRLLNLLNPIHATADFRSVSRYEREPYVMSADISKGFPNTGKGGWSWYTGAAGWMYRAILTKFLGVRREGAVLVIEPCVPVNFTRYQIEYHFGLSIYEISVKNDAGYGNSVRTLHVDGIDKTGNRFELIDDGTVHHVEVWLGI